jgi:(4S)-4-hydroxy-5-phosphonooxypentane-2,3-dione isomerase
MHVTLVTVNVIPDRIDDFIEASLANQVASAREPGALRFDLLHDPADPARFVIYEVYRDADAAAAHKETPHYLAWRAAVADWMAEPRRGESLEALALGPLDEAVGA